MDIRCSRCGEPWETDGLHEIVSSLNVTFQEANALFRKHGCAAMQAGYEGYGDRGAIRPSCAQSLENEVYGVMADVLGDDVDGLASMIEDFEAIGLL